MDARVNAFVRRLAGKEDAIVRREGEALSMIAGAKRWVAVRAVRAWVRAPILDEESVTRSARWVRLLSRAKHGIELREHLARNIGVSILATRTARRPAMNPTMVKGGLASSFMSSAAGESHTSGRKASAQTAS
eukprot:CAMPEP_0115883246 /NCGR_PEP_ID=MMETSP0287-20121206/29462_1 /TAXON_ID=412157 /ORGANISM="Chrysochromulina rotalis, Strain UIO044" /LENGTH=132 /DNA_ID=CAMNT_0003339431 /DNA_START=196 /DNA_END=595 /DNA_ORIENTATION=+